MATYYVSPTGNDQAAGETGTPWATFAHAMEVLVAGDTLVLKDGTYNQALAVTVSGEAGNVITISAENDGAAIIDGQDIRHTFDINVQHYINAEGIVVQNSNYHGIALTSATNITLQRISTLGGTASRAGFLVYTSSYITLKDCSSYGHSDDIYDIYSSDYVKVRRCWVHIHDDSSGFVLYGSSNSIVENCVAYCSETASAGANGFSIWAASYIYSADNNALYGNISIDSPSNGFYHASATHRIEGNHYYDNVSIRSARGLYVRGDADLQITRQTMIGNTDKGIIIEAFSAEPKDADYFINVNLKNSSIVGGSLAMYKVASAYVQSFVHSYNNMDEVTSLYNGTGPGTGEQELTPAYDTATYGDGAYLMVPAALQGQGESGGNIGAEVIYRYVDGVQAGGVLWPWPMEDRILAETGVSVTYAASGGLWTTLDGVYTVEVTPVVYYPDGGAIAGASLTATKKKGVVYAAAGGALSGGSTSYDAHGGTVIIWNRSGRAHTPSWSVKTSTTPSWARQNTPTNSTWSRR